MSITLYRFNYWSTSLECIEEEFERITEHFAFKSGGMSGPASRRRVALSSEYCVLHTTLQAAIDHKRGLLVKEIEDRTQSLRNATIQLEAFDAKYSIEG
jgi:hypothetical protein